MTITQKHVKECMVKSYIKDLEEGNTNYTKELLDAMAQLYIQDVIDKHFFDVIVDFYYGGVEKVVARHRPDLVQILRAKNN